MKFFLHRAKAKKRKTGESTSNPATSEPAKTNAPEAQTDPSEPHEGAHDEAPQLTKPADADVILPEANPETDLASSGYLYTNDLAGDDTPQEE